VPAKSFALVLATAAVIAGSAQAETVVVDPPPSFTYEADTVRQLQVRNEWGRYITFTGISTHAYTGTNGYMTQGTPDRTVCNTTGYSTSCRTIRGIKPSFVAGRPGGTERKAFIYELDCRDRTFDRKGDKAGGGFGQMKGWASVDKDPTALAVANKYCSIISTLPGPAVVATSTMEVESNAKEEEETDWTEITSDDEGTFWGIFLRRNGDIAVIREAYVYDGEKDEDEYYYAEYNCSTNSYRIALETDPYDFGKWNVIDAGTIAESLLKFSCNPR
jgi:hypothetical protein